MSMKIINEKKMLRSKIFFSFMIFIDIFKIFRKFLRIFKIFDPNIVLVITFLVFGVEKKINILGKCGRSRGIDPAWLDMLKMSSTNVPAMFHDVL